MIARDFAARSRERIFVSWHFAVAMILMAISLAGCRSHKPQARATQPPLVRVRLMNDVQQVAISSTAELTFTATQAINRAGSTFTASANHSVAVRREGAGFRLNEAMVDSPIVLIEQRENKPILVDTLPYRGSVRLYATADGFDVVNALDVDSYLLGVIAREMMASWDQDALRAQAVAARTYALYEIATRGSERYWDLYPDERSQVYGGVKDEKTSTTEAVQQTAGLVLTTGPRGEEKIFRTYFSACCGGVVMDASDVFDQKPIAPLRATSVGQLCSIAPRFSWAAITVEKPELTRRLIAWAQTRDHPMKLMKPIARVEIAEANQYKRPKVFTVIDTANKRYDLKAEQFREAVNTSRGNAATLWSAFCTPLDMGDSIRFVDGRGYGHGVGMCQWCASARATNGLSYEQILGEAYPTAVLMRAY